MLVKDGTYTDTNVDGNIVYVQNGGTSAAAMITFQAENRWGAKLNGQNNLTEYGWFVGAPWIRIEGFEVYGVFHDAFTLFNSNVQIVENHVHTIGRMCSDTVFGKDGLFLDNGSNILIERNLFHDIGRFAPGENGCNPSTENYKNHDHGLYFAAGSTITVRNNIFYNVNRGWKIQLYPNAVTDLKVLNNTFVGPNPYNNGHVILSGTLTNATFQNNIFSQPTTAAFIAFSPGTHTNVTISENLTDVATMCSGLPAGVTCTNNLPSMDPEFVNAAGNNYHLLSTSGAINSGATLTTDVPNDYDGVSRPQGGAYDIGAFEFVGGGGPLVAPGPPLNFRIIRGG